MYSILRISDDQNSSAFLSQVSNLALVHHSHFLSHTAFSSLSHTDMHNFISFEYGPATLSFDVLSLSKPITTISALLDTLDNDILFRVLLFGPEYRCLFAFSTALRCFFAQHQIHPPIAVEAVLAVWSDFKISAIPSCSLSEYLSSKMITDVTPSSPLGSSLLSRSTAYVLSTLYAQPAPFVGVSSKSSSFPTSSKLSGPQRSSATAPPRSNPPRIPSHVDLSPLHHTCVHFLKHGYCQRYDSTKQCSLGSKPLKHAGLFRSLPQALQSSIRDYFQKYVAKYVS